MAELTVASTTDTQQDIDKAAGLKVKAEEPAPKPETPPEKPVEVEAETEQEVERKPGESKSAYQKRIDTLTRRIAELEKQVHRAPEPEPEPVQAKSEPETGTYQQWVDSFDAAAWMTEWIEKHPGKPYERAILALNDYQNDIRTNFQRQTEAQTAAADKAKTDNDALQKRIDLAKKKYDDWDEVMSANQPIHNGVMNVLGKLDNGPDVAYFLQTHHDVVDELNAMDEAVAMAEVGWISKQLGTKEETSPSSEEPPEKQVHRADPVARRAMSSAPQPISPVGGSSTKSSVQVDELPYSEYKRVREQQLKNKYRR
jgi:hypothetical protein